MTDQVIYVAATAALALGIVCILSPNLFAQPEENCLNFVEGQPRAECWRRKAFRQGASLARAYLVGMNFKGTSVLAGRQLTGANLSRANLSSARLSGAQLTGSDLSYADLSGADLIGADLTNANLSGTNLNGAIVSRQARSGMNVTRGVNFDDWKRRGGKVVNDIEAAPPTNAPQSSNRTVTNFLGMQFVEIPRGSFTMGEADRARFPNADPAGLRQVTINYSYLIGQFEVTQWQWQRVTGQSQQDLVERARSRGMQGFQEFELGKNGSDVRSWGEGANIPIHWVSWNDAANFVQRLSAMDRDFDYRLPSKSEWEYAARAGTRTTTPFGNQAATTQVNCFDRATQNFLALTIKPIGSYPPNNWGLYEVIGNVSEWVEDFTISSNGRDIPPTDGSAFLTGQNSKYRLRDSLGGWFGAECHTLNTNYTYYWGQEDVYYGMGLRIVAIPERATSPVPPTRPPVNPVPTVPQKLNAPMRTYPKENQEIKLQGVRGSGAVKFGWQPVPGAIAYVIDVEELKGGRWVPHTRQRTTENTFWVQQFPLGGGRWRVTTLGPYNFEGHTTQWWSFKVDLAINPF